MVRRPTPPTRSCTFVPRLCPLSRRSTGPYRQYSVWPRYVRNHAAKIRLRLQTCATHPPAATRAMVVQDSNAAVFVNGHAVRLKVTRFNESDVRAEVVSSARLAPLLNPPGHLNSIVVQLFSWGPITQFQRTGAVRVCVCVCVCVCV